MRKLLATFILVFLLSGCVDGLVNDEVKEVYTYDIYSAIDSIENSSSGGGHAFIIYATFRYSTDLEYSIDLRLVDNDGGIFRVTISETHVNERTTIYFIDENETPYVDFSVYYVNESDPNFIKGISSSAFNSFVISIDIYIPESTYLDNVVILDE